MNDARKFALQPVSITYTYDQLNRLSLKSYPDTTTVNYTYDNDSRLTQVSDPTGTYQFTFDNMGRLTGTTSSYAFLTGRNFTTGYGYDAASNRTSFADPESGSTAYVYDTLNRLQTLTPPAAISGGSFGFGYDALSRRTSLTRPNSVNTSYTYDNLSRLLSVTHAKGGVTLDGATYTLDNAGNRNSKADLYAGVTTNYGYDNIYQLLSATQGASTTESFTYDPVGNRLSNLSGSGWSNNTSNELTSRPGVTYTYDNNGNALTKTDSTGTTNYTWNFENRLTSVTLPGSSGTVSFKSDPFGRRIYKSSSSGTSIYAYDGDNLVEETNASGGVVARYSQGLNIDEPLAMLRSSTTSYYHADGLGSVTSLTNAAGTAAQNYTYDSFGNIIATTGSLVNSFRYSGREWDTETSLYYYRSRYYDPTAGRFLNEDAFGFGAGANFYAYTGNGSPNRRDPYGLDYTVYKSVMGPTIYVNASITLYGPGATDALAANWQRNIIETWNNNPGFGKCDVVFNVKVINDPKAQDARHAVAPFGYPGANNFIYVPVGNPADVGDPHINPDLFTGTIPDGSLPFAVTHEFGHLLHLYDSRKYGIYLNPFRPNSDIMNERNTISSYDVNRIMGNKVPSCQCQ